VVVVEVAATSKRIGVFKMKTTPSLILSLVVMLLGSSCQHAAKPSLTAQENFFKALKASNPLEERALQCAQYQGLTGRFDLALEELGTAVASDPHNTRLLNAMGNCYDKLGKYDRAREIYERILAEHADNFPARNNLGYSCYLSGDLSRAESIFQEILSKNPQDTVARNNLGLVWCRQGKDSAALGLWQKTDGEIQAREKLAQVLASLDKSGNLPAGPVPQNSYQHTAAVQGQAGRPEKETGPKASARQEPLPIAKSSVLSSPLSPPGERVRLRSENDYNAACQLSRPLPEDQPAGPSPVPNPVSPAAKRLQPAHVKVEDVQMIVQPAASARVYPKATVAEEQAPDQLEADYSLRSPQYSARNPQRDRPRYRQPKIIEYNPNPQPESQSFKKCLDNGFLYQNRKSSGRQDYVF
jgi:Tfp pilus assembly protein PilF